VRLAILPITISGRPSPTGLRGQRDHSPQIGDDAKITNWRGPTRRRRQPVVKSEVVKAGRCTNTPRRQLRQPPHRNTLHSGNASIVDKGRRDHADVAFQKSTHQFLGLRAAGLPLGDVHGNTE
jgi:hypothetical protein